MTRISIPLLVFACATASALSAHAGPPTAPAATAPAAAPVTCKAYNGAACCDPGITAHLPKAAVYKACGESDATFLGEMASKEGCKYFFKVGVEKPEDTIVTIYAPKVKDVPASPQDPFFSWKRVGKAFMVDRATSPKAASMTIGQSGLWLPGKGYYVSVTTSSKVCTKPEATKLAASMK